MALEEYKRKRNLRTTPEPSARLKSSGKELRFVVHKHAASHLHYDIRLELDGVLKSWAVPKGPSLDPSVKRLAMMVEDHPFSYKDFEGIIPEGNYGAGKVIIWDEGTYHSYETAERNESEAILRKGLKKGDLKFELNGHKLKGKFALVKIKADEKNSWLLVKKQDDFAGPEDITKDDRSVVSGWTVQEIGQERGDADQEGSIASMPHNIQPMLATLVKDPFDNPSWLFEIKFDGFRAIAEINNHDVLLYSRNNHSFNQRFAPIVESLKRIGRQTVLDGEIVVLDDNGRSDFQLLQNYQRTGRGNVFYFVFDLLYLDGKDLRSLPLGQRKEILRKVLPDLPHLAYADHISEFGTAFFTLAQERNLEGIVAKRESSRYLAGKRTGDWLKIKTRQQQEAIVCGFTEPRGSRKRFGALVLGAYERGELIYIGHSGGGFDESSLNAIHQMLLPLVQSLCPFRNKISTNMPVTWVKPVLVCEVAFTEWTAEGQMRQPVFLGLRDDVDPRTVRKEGFADIMIDDIEQHSLKKGKTERDVVIGHRKIRLSNLDKVFWPEEKYTKRDVIEYYRTVADVILPYLKDRPQSLYRTPHGIHAEGFFHKDVGDIVPDWAKTERIYSESNAKNINYLICQDEATLVYIANLGCIEINPWLSRVQKLDYPDYLVIDLDPEDIAFDKVVETALAVKEVLDRAGAAGYPKTSGATGMHVYVPLQARYDYDTATTFARLLATIAHELVPEFTSLVRNPGKRQKKVYLDYLQNRKGQTLAAPYSLRPKEGAPVSTPLEWGEVKQGLDPHVFTIRTIHGRLEKVGDLFRGVLEKGVDIGECLSRLERGMS